MNSTSIEWCNRPETRGPAGAKTWNPIRARIKPEHISNPAYRPRHSGTFCTRISPGCTNCYASAINKRFGNGLEFTVPNLEKIEFFIDERILQEPLKQKKPCTIFVGDMFDLFHEAIPDDLIGEVFAVMEQCRQHTFQVLTKRAGRMYEFFKSWGECGEHIWPGVSVENPKYALERIPVLRGIRTAGVHFLSVEPQLEFIDLGQYLSRDPDQRNLADISWVICGGESGPGARPFNPAWANSLLRQCRAANVPFFMKQVGSNPEWDNEYWQGLVAPKLKNRKGGDMSEWPPSLQIREFPNPATREPVTA